MIGTALERVFREAGGRIIAALASRFRDLAFAEDLFAEACARALEAWPPQMPRDPAAWLYRVALRAGFDAVRRRHTHAEFARASGAEALHAADLHADAAQWDAWVMPDERLRLIFICCHPAVAVEARAALTLRLVCGLSALEIARAFLVTETTLEQRLVRAKRKIAEAGVPFELPGPDAWPERLDAVLSTLEIAYAKAHEDAAGAGPHASYAVEVLQLTRVLAELLPGEPEVLGLAALVRLAEARRPARVDAAGVMVPIAEQDPATWRRPLIDEAAGYLGRVPESARRCPRVLQARLHAAWCSRSSLAQAPPWRRVLALYDELLLSRDDVVVRLNRLVAVAETAGGPAAWTEFEAIEAHGLAEFAPFHALRADLLRRVGRFCEARDAYAAALSLVQTPAERAWLAQRVTCLPADAAEH